MDLHIPLQSLIALATEHIDAAHILAFFVGFVPALFWLFFWLAEDRKHPEPKRLILLSFVVGILMVPLALFLEQRIAEWLFSPQSLTETLLMAPSLGIVALVIFAGVEEFCKWIAAYAAALWSKEVDEPIDYLIYMIAAALGFAAYENALFLFTPFNNGMLATGLVMGNLRAIGATLLHVVASSFIGFSLAAGFYKTRMPRIRRALIGAGSAIALHGLFNLAIMRSTHGNAMFAFIGVWISIIILLVLFERAKKFHPTF